MKLRTLPLAVGLGAVVLGFGLAVVGAPVLPSGAVSELPTVAVSVFAGAVAILALLVRSLDGDPGPRLPETDSKQVAVPGDDLDAALVAGSGEETIRRRVEKVATSVLEREGLSPSEATAALRRGQWTDDDRARQLFDGTPVPFRARLSGWLGGIRPFHRRVAVATAELLRRDDDR